MKIATGLVGGCALLLCASHASGKDAMAAEVLFDEAVAQMKAGRFTEACPKIAESQRLEPRAGTLFTLAQCWAEGGKPATAIARYREYLRVFGRMSDDEKAAQRGRDRVATEQIATLEARVPKLRVVVLGPIPKGTVVTRSNVELGKPSMGAWLPLDPGEHEIVGKAPGGPATTVRVELSMGDRRTVELNVKPAAPKPAPESDTPRHSPMPQGAQDTKKTDKGLSGLQIGAIGAGVVALAGLVVGTTTGLMVLNRKEKLKELCGIGGDPGACTPEGKTEANSIDSLATLSTVSFAIGGAAGAASMGLLLLDTPSKQHAGAPWQGGRTPLLLVTGRL